MSTLPSGLDQRQPPGTDAGSDKPFSGRRPRTNPEAAFAVWRKIAIALKMPGTIRAGQSILAPRLPVANC